LERYFLFFIDTRLVSLRFIGFKILECLAHAQRVWFGYDDDRHLATMTAGASCL